jgi:L-ascorbate metabolism protein UlaG (beta-lactamase superfamily)
MCAADGPTQRHGLNGRRLGVGLTYVGHATVLIAMDGVRVLTDPLLRDRVLHLRRRVGAPVPAVGSVDVVLISHSHYDHLDRRSLARIPRGTRIVAPRKLAGLLRRIGHLDVVGVDQGDQVRVGEARITATHAEHDGRRRPLGRNAGALGYLLEGTSTVFFAGDTELFEGMAVLGGAGIDVALLPIWGWGSKLGAGHMDPRSAAEALRLLRPEVAVPIHWGTLAPAGWRSDRSGHSDDPAAAFLRHAAELAPDVDVAIIQPGESVQL